METDDFLEEAYSISKEDLEGLIKKGLIELVGYDPLGRSVYANTELGNAVADELDRLDGESDVGTERQKH